MGFTNKIKAIKEWLKINQRINPDTFITKKKENLLQKNTHTSSIAYFNNKTVEDSNKEIKKNLENYYSIKSNVVHHRVGHTTESVTSKLTKN